MKKRIIAFVLVVVMSVMALVSCGQTRFDYASEDLSKYATFSATAFADALKAIEIEDSDFTTDATVRAQKVLEQIYNTLTDKVVAVGKKETAYPNFIGERDVVYYNYYATTEVAGVVHTIFYESMEEARITNSSYKTNHVIELGKTTTSSDEKANEFREALKAALSGKDITAAYSTDSSNTPFWTKVDNKDVTLAKDTKLVMSYTVNVIDADKNPVPNESKTVNYEEVIVGENNTSSHALLNEVLKKDYNNSIGKAATFKDGAATYSLTKDGKTYTYSNVKVLWKVVSPTSEFASFSMVRFTESSKVKDINNVEVELKDATITYHIYPVSIIKVPEYDATSLLTYILGSSIKTTSLEIFGDETYKVGEEKLSALVDELTKIYAGTTENDTVSDAKAAYEAAKATVDAAGDDVTDAEEEALDAATKAYEDAKKAAAKEQIAKILTATSVTEGAKTIADAIKSEYTENVEHSLTETYNSEIIEKVAKKVYEAIDKSVTMTGEYPESVVKEAYDHLYESYEYAFYKEKHGTSSTAESEYSFHKGDFVTFLTECDGHGLKGKVKTVEGEDIWTSIEKAITEEAKSLIAPVIKIYVVAKELNLNDAAKADLLRWADEDYKVVDVSTIKAEDYATTEEYDEAVAKAEETNKANANAKKEAERFLVTNEVFNQYKEEIGKAAYESFVESYGEENLRTALQFEKIMNYLTSTSLEETDDHNHPAYVEREDGKLYIKFRYKDLVYNIVEDTDTDADDGADE